MKTITIQNATIVVDKIVGWTDVYEGSLVVYTLSERFEFNLGDDIHQTLVDLEISLLSSDVSSLARKHRK